MSFAEHAVRFRQRRQAPEPSASTHREKSEQSEKSPRRAAATLPADCFCRRVCPILGPCGRRPCRVDAG